MAGNPIRYDGYTPIGRIVQGGFDGTTTDADGKPLVYKTGPKAGQSRTSYFMALAIAKNNPEWPDFLRALHWVAANGFPSYFDGTANNDQVQQINFPFLQQLGLNLPKPRDFSFKVIDGDGRDSEGNPNSDKEGFAGHWIIRFSTNSPFKAFMHPDKTQLENPGQVIKRGYYARIAFNSTPNTGETPGIYVNPDMVLCVGYGPIIVGGKDYDTAFKGLDNAVGGYVPEGMSSTPTDGMSAGGTSTTTDMPGTNPPQQPNRPGAPNQQNTTNMPNNSAPGANPNGQPNQQFVQNAGRPGGPPPPGARPGPPSKPQGPVYEMTALAEGFTREQWHESGWSDADLLSNGKMIQK